ncbi:hypothetical protein BC936DRAFT_146314 [Jimgerdemannia flammicorona]|uniref:E3 ubiquitin-protein ligase listerin n=1 Tax=Jimgerdemannia flammicorona TaxID=994334 RepID=A0A433D7Y7_9FUNG|nr:hypothetical protein BC936DRAFT_146314 [Jimgerdemannia flammicorona]
MYLGKVFSDQASTTQGELWDSLLMLTKTFSQSWIIAGARKPMLPKLYHFLRSGAHAHGIANVSYPCMLALLAHLPEELTSAEKDFHKNIFINFWKGLSSGAIDRSNSHIFLNAYAECLLYYIARLGQSDDETAKDTRAYLVNVELWRLVDIYLVHFQIPEIKDKLQPTSTCNILAIYLVKLGTLTHAEGVYRFSCTVFLRSTSHCFFSFSNTLILTTNNISHHPCLPDLFANFWTRICDLLTQTITNALLPVKSDNPQEDFENFCRRTGDLLVDAKDKTGAEMGPSVVRIKKLNILVTNSENLPSLLITTPSIAIDPITTCLVIFLNEHPNQEVAKGGFDIVIARVLKFAEPRRQLEVLKMLLDKLNARKPSFSLENTQLDEYFNILLEKLGGEGFGRRELDLRNMAEDITATSFLFTDPALLSPSIAQSILTHFSTTLSYFNHSHYLNTPDLPAPADTVSATSADLTRTVVSILRILQKSLTNRDFLKMLVNSDAALIVADVFDFTFVKPEDVVVDTHEEVEVRELVRTLVSEAETCWKKVVQGVKVDEALLAVVGKIIVGKVKESIADVRHSASPADFVGQIAKILSDLFPELSAGREKVISAVLFDEAYWHSFSKPFEQYTREAFVLAIVDPIVGLLRVPTAATFSERATDRRAVPHDLYGLTMYGRISLFAVDFIKLIGVPDFFAATANRDWVLLQLLLCKLLREDGFAAFGISGIWDTNSHVAENAFAFRALIQNVQGIVDEYLKLVSMNAQTSARDWNARIVRQLQEGSAASTEEQLDAFIGKAFQHTVGDTRGHHWARVFRSLVSSVARELKATAADIEPWLKLVKTESNGYDLPTTAAIVYALKNILNESMKFKTLQNELASKLSSVSRADILSENNDQGIVSQCTLSHSAFYTTTKRKCICYTSFRDQEYPMLISRFKFMAGWRYLTLLNASAPEMGSIFIPQQRAIYLVQVVRKWYEGEGAQVSGSCQVDAQVAKLLTSVASVIQELSGSHWEFMLDQLLVWMENSDPLNSEDLVLLNESMKLFAELRDLAEINDDIGASLDTRKPRLSEVTLVLLLKETKFEDSKVSKPRAEYEELLSQLADFIPESLLQNKQPIKELCELLNAPTEAIQKCAFALFQTIVKGTVRDLSVKLEFTVTEEPTEPKVAEPLFENINHPPDLNALDAPESAHVEEAVEYRVLGFLLSWMLLFDHFEETTFKLKEHYVAQVKEANSIAVLLPFLFQILGLGHAATPFDLSKWEITQLDVQSFDTASDVGFSLLASHLYYRALKHLPSFVRIWWAECKNRPLIIAVESYTEKFFSSLIIAQELASITRPEVKTQLEDETMTVKTSRVTNEVTASYKIDEQTMEMAIRLPANFPLRQVDVEGLQRVGVPEGKWRGWLLATSAIIAVQNGDIVDALLLFKRNAKLHFEGVEDCTICYSIISIQDRSLPNKQCQTCKNRFHASCFGSELRTNPAARFAGRHSDCGCHALKPRINTCVFRPILTYL